MEAVTWWILQLKLLNDRNGEWALYKESARWRWQYGLPETELPMQQHGSRKVPRINLLIIKVWNSAQRSQYISKEEWFMPQTLAYIVWPVLKQWFVYAAIPRVELPVSRSDWVSQSVSAPTDSGSVICIPGNGVYTSHCAKHTTLVDP